MAKGIDFEEKVLNYLKFIFQQIGFSVIEARRQKSGTQNGFDIRIGFLDNRGRERKFYFECKDYKTQLSWNDIAVKIQNLYFSNHRPDGYIALSPHLDFSNVNINILDKLPSIVKSPIRFWTPETNIKEYFSLDEALFESIYRQKSNISSSDKIAIKHKLRSIIIDILQQKDELAAKKAYATFPKELTLKIPRIHQDSIVGRTNELNELYSLLFKNEHIVVINGLAGIGKTTLAQGYMSKFYKEYQHIVWVTQLTNHIESDIINTEGLTENLSIYKEGKNVTQLFQEIIRRLKTIPNKPNLLILDNVDAKLIRLKNFLPGQPIWHILATSREHIEGFYLQKIDFLSLENAIVLFKKYCSLINEEDQIVELIKTLDYHTLTIEILAKTAQLRRTDIEILKRAIEEDLESNVYIEHKGDKIARIRSYISAIFNFSELDEEKIWLMKQFTCLPSEFQTYKVLNGLLSTRIDKKAAVAESLNELVKHGWLLYNIETDAYKMHRIIKEVVIRKFALRLQEVEGLMDNVIKNLYIDNTKDNPVDIFQWVSYGSSLLNNFQDDTSEKVNSLRNNLALALNYLGDFSEARPLMEKALCFTVEKFGFSHPKTGTQYSNLALILRNMGDYFGSRVLLQKAMRIFENSFGSDHLATIEIYSSLATVLYDQGDIMSSKALMEKAMRSAEKNFGPDHPITAVRYSNFAIVLQSLGDYTQARVLLEKAIYSDEKNFEPEHPHTAIRYSNLAAVLQNLKDYSGARILLEKTVRSVEKQLGSDHPTTALRYAKLASVLQDLGDYVGARPLLEKAISSDERNFGPDHPITAENYSNLAVLLRMLGDYANAKMLLEKAISCDEKSLGSDNPSTAVKYSNLAILLMDLGNYSRSLKLMEKSLSIFKKKLPENHLNIYSAQLFINQLKSYLHTGIPRKDI